MTATFSRAPLVPPSLERLLLMLSQEWISRRRRSGVRTWEGSVSSGSPTLVGLDLQGQRDGVRVLPVGLLCLGHLDRAVQCSIIPVEHLLDWHLDVERVVTGLTHWVVGATAQSDGDACTSAESAEPAAP